VTEKRTRDLYEVPQVSDGHIVDSAVSFILKRDAEFLRRSNMKEPTDEEKRENFIRLKLRAQKYIKYPLERLYLIKGPMACYVVALRELRGDR
jgi:hypothetical protein